MLGAAQNFDRDLYFSSSRIPDLDWSIGEADEPNCAMLPGGAIRNFAFFGTPLEVQNIGDGEIAMMGCFVRKADERRVYRVQGQVRAYGEGWVCGAFLGSTGSSGANAPMQDWHTLVSGASDLIVDLTVCFEEPQNVDGSEPANRVIGMYVRNLSGNPDTVGIEAHLSVQDLSVAPPEYEAARR